MSKYKVVAFDIDGVLNEHGGNILPESIEAIDCLINAGLRVVFASGKHAWYVQGGLVWSGLLSPETLIVAENGGVVYEPRTRRMVVEEKHLRDVRLIKTIFRNLHSHDDGYVKFAGITVWEEPKETLFCLFPKNEGEVAKLAGVLNEIVEINQLQLRIVENPDSVDVLQSGINKATGLNYLCEWLAIEPREIIAFGDNYNDLEMLNYVGLPVTLGNGVEQVKKLVKTKKGIIANKNYGKGVLEVVEFLKSEGRI